MWTANVKDILMHRGRVGFTIIYEDNSIPQVIEITYKRNNLDDAQLEALCRSEIARFIDTNNDPLTYSESDSVDVSTPVIPPPDPPTPEQLARRKWFDDWEELKQLQLLKEKGIFVNDTRISVLETRLTNDFLDEYLSGVG